MPPAGRRGPGELSDEFRRLVPEHVEIVGFRTGPSRVADSGGGMPGPGYLRVGPSLADPPGTKYAGGSVHKDISCRQLGPDVKTWIEEELVDYVCPSLPWPHLPGLPKTAEFVALARNKNVGIYSTIFPLPGWIEGSLDTPETTRPIAADDVARRLRYREELGAAALPCYQDGADGISTFNWVQHHQPGMVKHPGRTEWGLGCIQEQMAILPHFRNAAALRQYLGVG